MKLFLLNRKPTGRSYDVVRSMVVRAQDENEARQEAAMKAMDEGGMAWLQPSMSYCHEISLDQEAQVLCIDANAG